MKYLRRFKGIVCESVYDNIPEIKSIISDLEEEYNLTIDISKVDYHISSKETKFYSQKKESPIKKALSLTIEDENGFITMYGDKSILPILRRLKLFADTINCDVHIDPDCKSRDFLDLEEFIGHYSDEELNMIDIIIYNK